MQDSVVPFPLYLCMYTVICSRPLKTVLTVLCNFIIFLNSHPHTGGHSCNVTGFMTKKCRLLLTIHSNLEGMGKAYYTHLRIAKTYKYFLSFSYLFFAGMYLRKGQVWNWSCKGSWNLVIRLCSKSSINVQQSKKGKRAELLIELLSINK